MKTAALGQHTNALIDATSPYLLQHAHNPVNWVPWSQSALDTAKKQDKMIFVSIGYSSCHWCHVMRHESFEDESVAEIMNEKFVCVKVDREERPDVDAAYMSFIQATSGRGGWPLNAFLTSDGEPLFGGTYFPTTTFTQLMDKLITLWETEREQCLSSAKDITAQLRQVATAGVSGIDWEDLPSLHLVQKAINHQLLNYDPRNGGFGSAPKFPSPPNTFHLLHRYYAETRSKALSTSLQEAGYHAELGERALESSAFTLARIARGGITDALGGGIARYSVDEEWKVPHFEKMLYDQGQLLSCFSEAVQLSSSSSSKILQAYLPEFKAAIQGIIEYLSRDLSSPEGAFYAAEDADSLPTPEDTHGKEGAFYVWQATEIEEVLGRSSPDHKLVCSHYGVQLDGNISPRSDPHGELIGMNILHSTEPLHVTCQKLDISIEEGQRVLKEAKHKLFERREKRPRPLLDDKIITSWNFLAISGLTQASKVLSIDEGGAEALYMAERCADFMWTRMWDEKGKQFLRSRRGSTKGPLGFDVDYAFAVQGLLDLYQVTFKKQYLERALRVQASQDRLFWDTSGPGGYLISQERGDGNILGRQRADQDGAEPTSTSVAAHNWLRLRSLFSNVDTAMSHITDLEDNEHTATISSRNRVAQCILSSSMILQRAPHALGTRLTALQQAKLGPIQIIVVGDSQDDKSVEFLDFIKSQFIPRATVIYVDTSNGVDGARERLGQALVDGNEALRSTLEDSSLLERGSYVTICQDFTCGLPIRSIDDLKQQLS
ncbi:hypothetical protein CBS101457_004539 [Exobasidium rhododendri]|nr:hypothetical protein CBS101457_004539 [Exobasidium rhododendri]